MIRCLSSLCVGFSPFSFFFVVMGVARPARHISMFFSCVIIHSLNLILKKMFLFNSKNKVERHIVRQRFYGLWICFLQITTLSSRPKSRASHLE